MSKFKPGQKVVKLTDWTCNVDNWRGQPIHKGETHTVRESYMSACGVPALRFVGINNPTSSFGTEFGYTESEYAPLIEPATGFVEVSFAKAVETEPKICAS